MSVLEEDQLRDLKAQYGHCLSGNTQNFLNNADKIIQLAAKLKLLSDDNK
jgi:hypothetical protein